MTQTNKIYSTALNPIKKVAILFRICKHKSQN